MNSSQPPPRGQTRGRGRGRGRPNFQHPSTSRPSPQHTPVPKFSLIHPNIHVSIILKQDQPTGRQVQGVVTEVLTRGDHPRGVKVRLRDGRVGRVQRVLAVGDRSGEEGDRVVEEGLRANMGFGTDGEWAGGDGVGTRKAGGLRERTHRPPRFETDHRTFPHTDYHPPKPSETGLFAALEEADRAHEAERGWGRAEGVRPELRSEMLVCPVCGEFEGDEKAVGRHVGGHFGEG